MTFQWSKDGSVLQGQTAEMLPFSPLRLSDAGKYTCEVTVDGVVYSSDEDVVISSKAHSHSYTVA